MCGLIAPTTLRGNKYFLLLVNDLSRYMWVAMIPSKECAAVAIKEIQARAEGGFGIKLMALCTDREGGFTVREFKEYCVTKGVHHQHTTPYNPQQNGIVEHQNARWWQPPGACSRPRAFLAGSRAKR
jgi:hypothetical protein